MGKRLFLPLVLLLGIILAGLKGYGQPRVRVGVADFVPEQNVGRTRGKASLLQGIPTGGQLNMLVQLSGLPTAEERQALLAQGIALQDYVGGNAYWALVRSDAKPTRRVRGSRRLQVNSIMPLQPAWKMGARLLDWDVPSYAAAGSDAAKVDIRYARNASPEKVQRDLEAAGASISHLSADFRSVNAVVSKSALELIAEIPYILSIDFVSPPARSTNWSGRLLSRAAALSLPQILAGRGLSGTGVRVGMWDANVDHHPDFGKRLHTMEFTRDEDHGTHVAGTMMGAGLIDPKGRGMADGVETWAWNFGRSSNGLAISEEMLMTVRAHNISLTQNSYGIDLEKICNRYEQVVYFPEDQNLDMLAMRYPHLLHVFAAGNEQKSCEALIKEKYGKPGYGTSVKRSKNVLYVGAVNQTGKIADFSSWGPQDDGRMFPTVCAKGVDVFSTKPGAGYYVEGGTSMACPTVSGSLALVSERYRQLNKGQNMPADLLKALAANTAHDAGRPHPDFQYGYGILDAEAAVIALEKGYYKRLDFEAGKPAQKFELVLPKGARGVKVMLYWMDPVVEKAYTYGESILTNDLDLSVLSGGKTWKPWVCNPAKVEAPAVRAEDRLNNMEQVTLSKEELNGADRIEVVVNGKRIAMGPQSCIVCWAYQLDHALRVVSPAGPEAYAPGETAVIQLDGFSAEAKKENGTIEISYDGGKTYKMLGDLAYGKKYDWRAVTFTIPEDAPTTNLAVLRVIDHEGNIAVSPAPFTIAPVVENLALSVPECQKSGWEVTWDALPKGDDLGYEILLINPSEATVTPIGDVAKGTTSFTIPEDRVAKVQNPYISVAVRTAEGQWGPRAVAVHAATSMPVMLSPENPFFVEDFVDNPSPWFALEAGENTKGVYGQKEEAPEGKHIFILSAKELKWDFKKNPPFDPKNASNQASMLFCDVDLRKLQADDHIFLRLSAFPMGSEPEDKEVYFRVLDNGAPIADQYGVEQNSIATTPLPGEDGMVDYYYPLKGGEKHSLRIDFAAMQSMAALAINRIAIERVPAEKELLITDLRLPDNRGNMGVEKVYVTVKNESPEEVKDVEIKLSRNGEVVSVLRIDKLAPMTSAQREAGIDFATVRDMGEAMHIRAEASVPSDAKLRPAVKSGTVLNLGKVVPMPTSTVDEFWDKPVDPKQIYILEKPVLFTDNGGTLADFTSGQKSTLKVKPALPGMRVQVDFREFQIGEDQALMSIYTSDVPDNLKTDNLLGFMLRESSTDKMVYTSQAADGAITFVFRSTRGGQAPGWLADLRMVPNQNTVSLLSCSAIAKSKEAKGRVPVSFKLRNNWPESLGFVQVLVSEVTKDGVKLLFDQVVENVTSGEHEYTTTQGIECEAGMPKKIVVQLVAETDFEAKDNSLEGRALLDYYCTTDLLSEGANKPALNWVKTTVSKQIDLVNEGGYNAYYTRPPLVLYTEPADQGLTFELSAEPQEEAKLSCWVDWNDNGEFEAEELSTKVFKYVWEVTLPIAFKGNDGVHRARVVYAAKDTPVSPCPDSKLEGSMYDFTLDVRKGANATLNDLSVSDLQIGEAGVLKAGDYSLMFKINNLCTQENQYKGEVVAKLYLNGNKTPFTTQTIDLDLANGEYRTVYVNDKISLPAAGKYEVQLTLEAPKDPNTENNTQTSNVYVPGGKPYCIAVNREAKEGVALSALIEGIYATDDITIETWVKTDERKIGMLFAGENFRMLSLPDMPAPLASNAIALFMGGKKLMSPSNSFAYGRWNHVALTVSEISTFLKSCTVHLYINGEKVQLKEHPASVDDIPSFAKLQLGGEISASFKGIRIWSKAREAADIKQDMYEEFIESYSCKGALPVVEGYGSPTLNSTSGMRTGAIAAKKARIEQADNQGVWQQIEDPLIAGFAFEAQTRFEKTAEDTYRIYFGKGTPATGVKGSIIPMWPGKVQYTYKSNPVDENTAFDFSSEVSITATAELFGHTYTQTVSLTRGEDLSAACELSSLSLEKAQNDGLSADVTTDVTSSVVYVEIPTTSGKLRDEGRVVLSFVASTGATLSVEGQEITSGSTAVDMTKPLVLTVTAENGKQSKRYYVYLVRQQEVTLSIDNTNLKYGDAPVNVQATASSGLPISYRSSNANVATIVNGKLYVSKPGTVELVAMQQGGEGYKPAESSPVTITVAKAALTISPRVAPVPYGGELDWDFDYKGLVTPDDAYIIDRERLAELYEIKQGTTSYSPYDLLPKGEYTLEPKAGAKAELEHYNATLAKGTFSVVQGDLYMLSLTVQDKAGKPIAGARVQAEADALLTDTEGRVAWLVDNNDTYSLSISAEGYQTVNLPITVASADVEKVVKLEKAELSLVYIASAHGKVNGLDRYEVKVAKNGAAPTVVATAEPPYLFESWEEDGNKNPIRQDVNVQGGATYTASFVLPSYTVSYRAAEGGSLSASNLASQTVLAGGETQEISAVADADHYFTHWSDGLESPNRKETDVRGNTELVAYFGSYAELPASYNYEGGMGKFYSISERGKRPVQWINATKKRTKEMVAVAGKGTEPFSAALYSPRYKIPALQEDVRIAFRYVFEQEHGAKLKLEFSVDGKKWNMLLNLPNSWGDFETKQYTVTKGRLDLLKPYEFIQFRWVYYGKDVQKYALIDDVSFFEYQTGVRHTLSYVAEPAGSATFLVDGTPGTSQKVKDTKKPRPVVVVPKAGYRFVRWSDNTTKPELRTKMGIHKSETITAYLVPENEVVAHYESLPPDGGRIERNGAPLTSETLRKNVASEPFKAVASPGWEFDRWADNGSKDAERSFTPLSESFVLAAIFKQNTQVVTVSVAAHGKPLAGAQVDIAGQTGITDATGVLRFALPKGKFSCQVLREGYAFAEKVVEVIDRPVGVKIELQPLVPQSVTFVVRDGEQAVPQATVSIFGKTLETDHEGRATIFLPVARYPYSVSKGTQYKRYEAAVDLQPGEQKIVKLNLEKVAVPQPILLAIEPSNQGSILVKRGVEELKDKVTLAEGDRLVITAIPNTGYQLAELLVNGTRFTSGEIYTVGKVKEVRVKATFSQPKAPIAVAESSAVYTLSPNPATNSIRVEGLTDLTAVGIYSLQGDRLLACMLRAGESMDVSSLKPGLYLVRIGSATLRFVKM